MKVDTERQGYSNELSPVRGKTQKMYDAMEDSGARPFMNPMKESESSLFTPNQPNFMSQRSMTYVQPVGNGHSAFDPHRDFYVPNFESLQNGCSRQDEALK